MSKKKPKKADDFRDSKEFRFHKHTLYERAVQDAPHDVTILTSLYKNLMHRKALSLREDFCGTHWLCCEWVKSDPKRSAMGLDIDAKTIDYGTKVHRSKLNKEQLSRVHILKQNVLSKTKPVDIIVAGNFSYCIFKERKTLIEYFKYCYKSLNDEGIFTMDNFGGTDCECLVVDKTPIRDGEKPAFTYIWDQETFNPITRESLYKIHFHFRDGKKMKDAFVYDWRMWTIPELRECLLEAGFEDTAVFWEDEDEDEEPNGTFYRTENEENDPTWIAYIAGIKKKGKRK